MSEQTPQEARNVLRAEIIEAMEGDDSYDADFIAEVRDLLGPDEPNVPLLAAASPAAPAAEPRERQCGALATGGPCVLPRGHNRGRADIPEHHAAAQPGPSEPGLRQALADWLLRDIGERDAQTEPVTVAAQLPLGRDGTKYDHARRQTSDYHLDTDELALGDRHLLLLEVRRLRALAAADSAPPAATEQPSADDAVAVVRSSDATSPALSEPTNTDEVSRSASPASEGLRERIEALVEEWSGDDAADWHDFVPHLNRTSVVDALRAALADSDRVDPAPELPGQVERP